LSKMETITDDENHEIDASKAEAVRFVISVTRSQ
jgi:hypothetical protein